MTLFWLSIQSTLLLLKCMTLAFKAVPFKKQFVAFVSYAIGIARVAMKLGRLGRLEKYRNTVAPESSLWVFAYRYYSRRARDLIWGNMFYEYPNILRTCVSEEGSDMVRRTLGEGRGALIVGYHYGPRAVHYLMQEMCKIPARAVIGEWTFNKIRGEEKSALKPLLTAKRRYLADTDFLVAGKSVKEIVGHLRQRDAVFILNDAPSGGSGVTSIDFLGHTLNFSYFPFKVSLKYSVPVFFCIIKDDGAGGYRLVFVPCDESLGVEGCLKSYIELISEQIKANPFMWEAGEDFSTWVGERNAAKAEVLPVESRTEIT